MKYFYLSGKFVPPEKAQISIMTHAFNYGKGVFEGIRAYWNPRQKQSYIFRLKEHYRRMQKSCRVIDLSLPFNLEKMCKITTELLKKNNFKQDVYIRPICFHARKGIWVQRTGESDFAIFAVPLEPHKKGTKPLRVMLSGFARVDSRMIPSYAKICGTYVNSFLAGQDAIKRGFDEAILFNLDGTVAEATGMNVFVVKNKKLITPPLTANILPGITRNCVIRLAGRELGLKVFEKNIRKSDLLGADEVLLTGTGIEITAVGSIDRKVIKKGQTGPVTSELQKLYGQIVRGEVGKYRSWLTAVY